MQRVYWFPDLPWWEQASFWAVIGGGSLYQLVTGRIGGYWWVLPTIAWLMFAVAVIRRKPK